MGLKIGGYNIDTEAVFNLLKDAGITKKAELKKLDKNGDLKITEDELVDVSNLSDDEEETQDAAAADTQSETLSPLEYQLETLNEKKNQIYNKIGCSGDLEEYESLLDELKNVTSEIQQVEAQIYQSYFGAETANDTPYSGGTNIPVGNYQGSIGESIVNYAESFLGYNANSNKAGKNQFVRVTRGGGCDDFANYVVEHAVSKDNLASWYNNLSVNEKAWCPDLLRAAEKNGGTVDKGQMQTGDLVYLKINGKTHHMVICKEVKNGKLYTIESSGKGKVSNKTYPLSDVYKVIRPTQGK